MLRTIGESLKDVIAVAYRINGLTRYEALGFSLGAEVWIHNINAWGRPRRAMKHPLFMYA